MESNERDEVISIAYRVRAPLPPHPAPYQPSPEIIERFERMMDDDRGDTGNFGQGLALGLCLGASLWLFGYWLIGLLG